MRMIGTYRIGGTWQVPLLLGLALAMTPVSAQDIKVVGLFKDQAILLINGKQRILKVGGEVTLEGVTLVSANSKEAVLEIDGVQRSYLVGAHISVSSGHQPIVRIWPNAGGHYFHEGKINDHRVDFVVDTGATLISMNRQTALKLKLDYTKGKPSLTETASGHARVYVMQLQRVSLGAIELRDITAAVHESDNFPRVILLGNSFLNRLSLRREGKLLELKRQP